MGLGKLLIRLLLVVIGVGWALVMVRAGLWMMADVSDSLGVGSGAKQSWPRVGGSVLLASGAFIMALIAARLFPKADARLRLAFELLPWSLCLIVLIGEWI